MYYRSRDVVNASGHDFFFQKIFIQKIIFWGRFFWWNFLKFFFDKVSSKKIMFLEKFSSIFFLMKKKIFWVDFIKKKLHLKHSISFYIGVKSLVRVRNLWTVPSEANKFPDHPTLLNTINFRTFPLVLKYPNSPNIIPLSAKNAVFCQKSTLRSDQFSYLPFTPTRSDKFPYQPFYSNIFIHGIKNFYNTWGLIQKYVSI